VPERTRAKRRRLACEKAAGEPQHLATPGRAGFPPPVPIPDADGIAARVRRECAAQGIPETVEDPAVLSRVVTLAYVGLATPSRSP
jgi:hypothetical protein